MRFLLALLFTAFTLFNTPSPATAQDYSKLLRDFDAKALTTADKRFLQTALAFEGDYLGLLDGAWGRLSQRALDSYSRREFQSSSEDWHMAILALSFFQRLDQDGWEMRKFDGLELSLLFPKKSAIPEAPSEHFQNWRVANSSLSISMGLNTRKVTQNLHDYTVNWHQKSGNPYTVRKTNFAVTKAEKYDGSILYTRSNFIDGVWSTIMLSADWRDRGALNAVAASIQVGRASPIYFTTGGRLDAAITEIIAVLENESDESADTKVAQTNPPSESGGSAGTGFFVTNDGYLLTNAHVVEGCSSVLVDGRKAQVIASNDDFDLAVLRAPMGDGKSAAVFSPGPAKLNSDVTAIGYPYAGLLSGLNVTRGSVSSLVGLAGDYKTMQITAPVQKGNSGGPLVGPDGEVVGVVVSKLDALQFADAVGDLPQSVNFAVRGEIAKLFLAQNGINPELGASDERLPPVEIAEKATGFTAFIECP